MNTNFGLICGRLSLTAPVAVFVAVLWFPGLATAGDLFGADFISGNIYRFTPDGTRSTFASLGHNQNEYLTFDASGDLYDADYNANSIYKFTPSGSRSTFASGLSGPHYLAIDVNGNIFEADSGANSIYEFTSGGSRSTFAGGLSTTPISLAFDHDGNLFEGDGLGDIYKFTPSGSRSFFATGLSGPAGIVFDDNGNLFAAEATVGKILEFTSGGSMSVFASGLNVPQGLAFDANGNLFEADSGSGNIIRFAPDGSKSTFANSAGAIVGLAFAPTPSPEPSTLGLLGCGAIGVLGLTLRQRRLWRATIIATITLLPPSLARADVFNMPAGDTSLKFVTVGDPGNVADTTGYGAVGFTYRMGEYDVTVGQYAQFLNAVAATDTYSLFNGAIGGYYSTQWIQRTGSPGSYSYSVTGSNPQAANCPIFDVSWGDAARFCNWLQNGQGTASTISGAYALTETGAYNLNGGTSQAVYLAVQRNTGATYFIPSEDEWYKAAYYKTGGTNAGYWTYPTRSNVAPGNSLLLASTTPNEANYYNGSYADPIDYLTPVGAFSQSPGPYGTYDQGGDVSQWNEAEPNGIYRGDRGGAFSLPSNLIASSYRDDDIPANGYASLGFRVASVPEPGSIALMLVGAAVLLGIGWRRQRSRIMQGLLAAVMMASAFSAQASTIPMATVTVGNPGNANDTTNGSLALYGAVSYNYNIGTYLVTRNQYCAFLNSVAATDPYGLYNTSMGTDQRTASISRTGSSSSYSYAVIGDGQLPITCVSWYDAVRFVNWLGTGNTESGAYTITGGSNNGGAVSVPTTAQRAAWSVSGSAVWYLPDENEWYKAAYYDPTIAGSNKYWKYPTRNNSPPSNVASATGTNNATYYDNGYTDPTNYLTPVGYFAASPGPYGTYDMGGETFEWNDLNPDTVGSSRGQRGGYFGGIVSTLASEQRTSGPPTFEFDSDGFRVASSEAVPEPGSIALAIAGGALILALARRRCAARRV